MKIQEIIDKVTEEYSLFEMPEFTVKIKDGDGKIYTINDLSMNGDDKEIEITIEEK